MRVIALISGGKDSCYNMMQCIASGHEIVALANLQPKEKDELDSFMYQTVGHMGIPFIAEAMDLPLFRCQTEGISKQREKDYRPTENDEVEDLYQLLTKIKDEIEFEAVAVGAILSDYQRIRVENVCSRLKLVSLSYLWRRDQHELLQEMIDCEVKAIIIKVAALGLDPSRHLGRSLLEVQSHLEAMAQQYGLNVCGEGGEYETFTLDCPLFKKTIKIEESETVIHSNDPIAPVGYMNLTRLSLVDKKPTLLTTNKCYPSIINVKSSLDFIADLNSSTYSDLSDPDLSESELEMIEKQQRKEDQSERKSRKWIGSPSASNEEAGSPEESLFSKKTIALGELSSLSPISRKPSDRRPAEPSEPLPPLLVPPEKREIRREARVLFDERRGWGFLSGLYGYGDDAQSAMRDVVTRALELMQSSGLTRADLCSVNLYVRDLTKLSEINQVYRELLPEISPPVRSCVELPLPQNCHVVLEAVFFRATRASNGGDYEIQEKQTMHVQGISHWAPANIGPYSQASRGGEVVHMAGQIGLIPGSMDLIDGVRQQCKLSLRHVGRIALAAGCTEQVRDIVQVVCWLSHPQYVYEARRQFERCSNSALVLYAVCPQLPRGAHVEWSVWAHRHNKQFQYEETGCSIGGLTIAIRSRWNYERTVCAAVCHLSAGPANTSTTHLPDEELSTNVSNTTSVQITEALRYTISKLLRCHHNEEIDQEEASCTLNLRIFYRVNTVDVDEILRATEELNEEFTKGRDHNILCTILPVAGLQDSSTLVSICGVRFE